MLTTVDIPETVYRALQAEADREGLTVTEVFSRRLKGQTAPSGERASKRQGKAPVLESKHPGSLRLGEEGVYEYIPFP